MNRRLMYTSVKTVLATFMERFRIESRKNLTQRYSVTQVKI